MGRWVLGLAMVVVVASAVGMERVSGVLYTVGDTDGWGFYDYNAWLAGKTFYPGDELLFTYVPSDHDVTEVSQEDYNGCINNPLAVYRDGSTKITLKPSDTTRYFICGVPGHCDANMKLAITVTLRQGLPPPPTLPSLPAPPSIIAPSSPTSAPSLPSVAPTLPPITPSLPLVTPSLLPFVPSRPPVSMTRAPSLPPPIFPSIVPTSAPSSAPHTSTPTPLPSQTSTSTHRAPSRYLSSDSPSNTPSPSNVISLLAPLTLFSLFFLP